MVKRTITISSILLIIAIIIGIILSVSKGSFAADDIASGTTGTCSWVIDSNGVLTISATDGNEGVLGPYTSTEKAPWLEYKDSIISVLINRGVKANEKSFGMFFGLGSCTSIDVSNLDTSDVVNMSYMFSGCSKITTLDLSNFDTRKVTNMNQLFDNCSKLSNLNISNFDTSNVISMSNMFYNCYNLETIDVSGFNTSKVTAMSGMFSDCSKLNNLNISSFDTSNVLYMNHMFSSCSSLTSLNVSNFNTAKVKEMNNMFYNCQKLGTLDLSSFNTSNVTDMNNMFTACTELKNLDLSNFDTSKVIYMHRMFASCQNLESLNISSFDTRKVTNMELMFYWCPKLRYIDLSSFDTRNVTNMKDMFRRYEGTPGGGVISIKLGPNFTFKGKGISNYQLTLPKPIDSDPYTGKWIREEGEYGPYTSEELRDNYNGETMAGTWSWEKAAMKYSVIYSFIGYIPEGASELPETIKYLPGEEVHVAEMATAPGYTFSGWNKADFIMPEGNVTITGSFIPNTNTQYIVKHYIEDLEGESYTLKETETLYGTTNDFVEATAEEYEGFAFDRRNSSYRGNILGDGSRVFEMRYKRKTYNVSYSFTGEIPENVEVPEESLYKYGENVKVAEKPTAYGYIFSGWSTSDFVMPSHDVEITGEFLPDTDTLNDNDEIANENNKTNDKTTIFDKNDSQEISVKEKDSKISNPKTDDKFIKYLLYGFLGIILLGVVIKLKRKYSVKKNKIQF